MQSGSGGTGAPTSEALPALAPALLLGHSAEKEPAKLRFDQRS